MAEEAVHSLDKFTVLGQLVPTVGKAQIAPFGFRVPGQFRQMLTLGGSVAAMLDGGTRSPQHPRSSSPKGTEPFGKPLQSRVKSVVA